MGGVPEPEGDNLDPDWETLSCACAGDGAAFAALVERHQARLLRLCHRLLGDSEEAADAVQEVFLKTYRKGGKLEPRGRLYTWLYRIATNHCLNQLRRRRVVQFLSLSGAGREPDEAGEIDPADGAASPAEELESRRRWHSTRRRIGQLPPGQRAVLVLVKLEGLSYRETAAALGITVGAVESRLFRAMRNLLSQLEAEAQEPAVSRVTTPGEEP